MSGAKLTGRIMLGVLGCCLSMALALPVAAQDDCVLFGICTEEDPTNMKLTCSGSTVCTDADAGGTQIQITTDALPTFQISNTGTTGLKGDTGTAFLVVLVPSATPTLTFSASGSPAILVNTWSASSTETRFGILGVTPQATADTPIEPYLTAAQATDASITGFDVYLVDLGAYTDGTVIDVSFLGIDAFPVGTIFWAYLANSDGIAINSTPISQDLLEVVPEPTSLFLFGSGLLGFGALLRRRAGKKLP